MADCLDYSKRWELLGALPMFHLQQAEVLHPLNCTTTHPVPRNEQHFDFLKKKASNDQSVSAEELCNFPKILEAETYLHNALACP